LSFFFFKEYVESDFYSFSRHLEVGYIYTWLKIQKVGCGCGSSGRVLV
jgi:hypothetical protein